MNHRPTISLHPKLAAVIDAAVSLGFVFWVSRAQSLLGLGIWWALRAVLWAALISFMYYPPSLSRFRHWLTLAVFNLGSLIFLVFVDSSLSRDIVKILLLIAPLISFWLVPEDAAGLSVLAKPARRFRLILSGYALAGWWSGIAALIVFGAVPPTFTRVLVGLIGVLGTMFVSLWWWREYGFKTGKKFWLSAGILGLVMLELAYVFSFWPLGYLPLGLLLTWIWYILWLLLRFSLTPEGINWRRQWLFILGNAAAITLFLVFLARWK